MCDAHKALRIYARTPHGSQQLERFLAQSAATEPVLLPAEKEFTIGRALTWLALGGVMAGAAFIAAPHVLPVLGAGTSDMAQDAMFQLHNRVAGSGLAGLVNQGLAAVPLIGERLADGGWFNAVASGVVGIGGVLLGRSLHDDRANKPRYTLGSAIQYAALATSALIALPTVLTAISSGLIYAAMLTGGNNPSPETVATISQFIGSVGDSVGTIGNRAGGLVGLSGAAAMTPHFFTCGVAVLPVAVSAGLKHKDSKEAVMQQAEVAVTDLPKPSFAERIVAQQQLLPIGQAI